MNHLLISREYPPCTYPMGGIGTYVRHIARLLAEHGETVHVIAERWQGAPRAREVLLDGRLTIHRVWTSRPLDGSRTPHEDADLLEAMGSSPFPAQAFGWQAALLAERLVESEQVDVIEAQDYEAPLYYFLARRARGLGPSIQPPCFLHLHTTYEQVCRANEWSIDTPQARLIKEHEDGAIRCADSLLAPSRFLALQTEAQYALDPGSVTTIPYPIGNVPMLERTADTWTTGTICFVGRYEVRKGLLEWVRAAIQVAARSPHVRFEFTGADTTIGSDGSGGSVRARLESLVPANLHHAFAFRGPVPQHELWDRLRTARMAIVPSRWENFPNACVEAMCSGLPVLATPNGGMVEMIEDGSTGWIAGSNSVEDLAQTLARALAAPAEGLAAMGRRASQSIRTMCDNARTVERQLEFRRGLVKAGASRSLRLSVGGDPQLLPVPTLTGAGPIASGPSPSGRPSGRLTTHVKDALTSPAYTAQWLLWRLRRMAHRRGAR